MKYESDSEKSTYLFANSLGKKIKKGHLFGLIGDLGAGKTIFVKGFAKGLGVKENITSPTFVVMKVYDVHGSKKIKKMVHIDAYRVGGVEDLAAIGAEEYFEREDVVVLVEWAEEVKESLPKETKFITFNIKEKNSRSIFIDE